MHVTADFRLVNHLYQRHGNTMTHADERPFAPRAIADFRRDLETGGSALLAKRLAETVETIAESNAVLGTNLEDLAEAATRRGELSGIPFGVKDNIDALPFTTTGGSPALAGYRPGEDAPAVARLRAAGGVPAVKLGLHEFAFGVTSNNGLHGPVRNPFDPARVAGGSSGGNGVAIAAGLVPFALGTDTGGSVRIPASFCGISGFRPTTGRYPDGGVLTISRTRDTIGVMAATVEDIVLADRIIAGENSLPKLPERRLRIGIGRDCRAGLCAAVDAALAGALDQLRGMGCELVEIDTDDVDRTAFDMGFPIAFNEALTFWEAFLAEKRHVSLAEFTAQIASPDVKQIFEGLPELAKNTKVPYEEAMADGLCQLKRQYAALFDEAGIDAIVTSTVPVRPPLIGEDETFVSDDESYPTFPTVVRHTTRASVVGAPSLSIPAGFDRDGLPVGLQIDGPVRSDGFVLAIGRAFQSVFGRDGSTLKRLGVSA